MSKKAKKIDKPNVIAKYQVSAKDTGSPQVQIGILTARINNLADHLKGHRGDEHSRRGLLQLVGHRRRLLKWMKDNVGEAETKKLMRELGLS